MQSIEKSTSPVTPTPHSVSEYSYASRQFVPGPIPYRGALAGDQPDATATKAAVQTNSDHRGKVR